MEHNLTTASKVLTGYNIIDGLKEFGFNYLTSESCGYSMRGLFDIDETAQEFLSEFLGGLEFTASGWNAYDKKSVMLPKGQFLRELLIFCYLESGYEIALDANYESCKEIGIQPMIRFYDSWVDCQKEMERFKDWGLNYRIYEGKNRNQHAFSGRTY